MSNVWSGKLDCTFHGKMHWELNAEMWFASAEASTHHNLWKQMGVKITRSRSMKDKSKVYAPKGYDTDLASIPRAGWALVRAMIFSTLGNTFYKWFATTKTGKWFDLKVNTILDKVTNKHDEAVAKKSPQLDMFDNNKSGKS